MTERKEIQELQQRIGYHFDDLDLLVQALTHASYQNENPRILVNNERLEFLGDAVVGLAVAQKLWREHPEEDEGSMTRARARLVNEEALARSARRLGLGDALFLGNGEEATGGRDRDSVLSDAFEALVAAIYVEAGYETAVERVLTFLEAELEEGFGALADRDPRSRLQERTQALNLGTPEYRLTEVTGPTHEPHFVIAVTCGAGAYRMQGEGGTKKAAASEAAQRLLETLPEA